MAGVGRRLFMQLLGVRRLSGREAACCGLESSRVEGAVYQDLNDARRRRVLAMSEDRCSS